MHAIALELMADRLSQPGKPAKSLDVGSGSGYLCACMSLMNPQGLVVGIEHIPELLD